MTYFENLMFVIGATRTLKQLKDEIKEGNLNQAEIVDAIDRRIAELDKERRKE